MQSILNIKINNARGAMQKCMARAERIMEIQKRFDEEVRDEKIRAEWNAFGRDDEMGKDEFEDR